MRLTCVVACVLIQLLVLVLASLSGADAAALCRYKGFMVNGDYVPTYTNNVLSLSFQMDLSTRLAPSSHGMFLS